MVSPDYGLSWQTLVDFSVPGASGWYPQMTDMLVAGNDSSNVRIFLALNGNGAGGPQNFGSIVAFDGITGTAVGNSVDLGDFTNYGIVDIALCSDYKHSLSGSNPYSVAAVYSVSNSSGLDSLSYYFSDDGGLNFTGSYAIDVDSSGSYGDVDIAYGSYQNPPVGRFGVVFQKGQNLGVAFSDVGFPTVFSGYSLIDTGNTYTEGLCSHPTITIQSGATANSSSDYTSVIFAEVDNLSNSSKDIVSFYANDTQNGAIFDMEIIDSSSHFTQSPSIAYDSLNLNFVATYYDTTSKELPLIYHDINFPGTWYRTVSDYPDSLKFFTPTPTVSIMNYSNSIACSWLQLSDSSILFGPHQSILFDYTLSPVKINAISPNNYKFIIYPNPSSGDIFFSTKENLGIVKISIINSLGEVIYTGSSTMTENKALDIPQLSKGIYTVSLSDGINAGIQKLIVM